MGMTICLTMVKTMLMVLYLQNVARLMMARRDQTQRPTTKQRRQKGQMMMVSGHSAQ